jgi:mRNA interferase RelE/StbE
LGDYRVFETETFREDLAHISRAGLGRLKKKLQDHIYSQLRTEPHFGPNIKRLKNWDPPPWRYRVGAWRFFYEIDEKEKVLYMTPADHRGRAYQ